MRVRWSLAVGLVASLALVGCAPAEDWQEQATRWRLLEPGSERLVLDVLIGSSSCNRYLRTDVVETGETVEVRAFVEVNAAVEACTGDLQTRLTPVRIAEPIGSRELVGCEPEHADADCSITGPVTAPLPDEPVDHGH